MTRTTTIHKNVLGRTDSHNIILRNCLQHDFLKRRTPTTTPEQTWRWTQFTIGVIVPLFLSACGFVNISVKFSGFALVVIPYSSVRGCSVCDRALPQPSKHELFLLLMILGMKKLVHSDMRPYNYPLTRGSSVAKVWPAPMSHIACHLRSPMWS